MNDAIVRLFKVLKESAAEYYDVIVDFFQIQFTSTSHWKQTKNLLEFNISLIQSQGK